MIAIDLKVRVPLIFLVCALGYSGVILNRLDYDIRGLGLDRQALGFTHPNNLGAMMMVITIYLFYKKHKNFGVQDYLFLLFADYICWSVAVSRTSSIIITGVILVECLDSIISFLVKEMILQKIKHIAIDIAGLLTLIIPLGSIYLGMNYSTTSFYIALDSFFSSRFYLMHTAFKNNGITLLGQYYASKKDEKKICLCILFFIIAGFCENKMFYIGTNVFTLYIAVALYQSSMKIKK